MGKKSKEQEPRNTKGGLFRLGDMVEFSLKAGERNLGLVVDKAAWGLQVQQQNPE